MADLVPGRGAQNVLSVSGVQALLDEDTTLISYFTLEEQTLIFVITRSNFKVIASEVSRQELAHRVGYFRKVIPHRQPAAIQPAAQELYQLLIAPLADSLHTPRLIIIPHGPLHHLPFAALIDPDTNQYLIEHYELVTLPSASALRFIQENAERSTVGSQQPARSLSNGSALVVGNPTTGDYNTTASLAVERAGLSPLPFAEQEAEAIAALYGVEPLLRENATESAVREQVAGARVLYLAAHGLFNDQVPLSSLIALAPDSPNPKPALSEAEGSKIENSNSTDGWLTVGEVYGLDLSQTDLVVLSACQTQLGDLSMGDEVVGLTRAFFFAGTPNVVATLWKVDDEATSLLMKRFHTHLKEDEMNEAEALRQVQLELIEEYPDPYFWAGFVLSGDGGVASNGEASLLLGIPQFAPSLLSLYQSSLGVLLLILAGVVLMVVAVLVVIGGLLWWRSQKSYSTSPVEVQPTTVTGAELPPCPACETPNEPEARFCKNCGEPLKADTAPSAKPTRRFLGLVAIIGGGVFLVAVIIAVALFWLLGRGEPESSDAVTIGPDSGSPAPTFTLVSHPTETPTPTNTPTPGPIHLAPDGSGDYSSLAAAVEAAPEGATLMLAPGIYRLEEPLDIHRSLRLVGAGINQTKIESEAEDYVVRFSGDGLFTVENITFRHEGEAIADVLVVEGGEVDFARCRVTGAVVAEEDNDDRAGLRLAGSTTGLVRDCLADGNRRVGIMVEGQAQVILEGNVCLDNGVGIRYRGNASGLARQNRCIDNAIGFGISENAKPKLERNVCSDNEDAGMLYRNDTGGVARQNQCNGNDIGILVGDQARPTLEENICSENESGGIAYVDNASGVARENRCTGNGIGLFASGQAKPTLEANICEDNGRGIGFTDDAGGVARQNQCRNNDIGILVIEQAQPVLEENICTDNRVGIFVGDSTDPNLVDNDCYNNVEADIQDER